MIYHSIALRVIVDVLEWGRYRRVESSRESLLLEVDIVDFCVGYIGCDQPLVELCYVRCIC